MISESLLDYFPFGSTHSKIFSPKLATTDSFTQTKWCVSNEDAKNFFASDTHKFLLNLNKVLLV